MRLSPRSTLFPYTTLFRSKTIPVTGALKIAAIPAAAPTTRSTLRSSAKTQPRARRSTASPIAAVERSEEHTSELQSRQYLVCRLLLEKKKNQSNGQNHQQP